MRKILNFIWAFWANTVANICGMLFTLIVSTFSIFFLMFKFKWGVWAFQRFWGYGWMFVMGKIVSITGKKNIEKGKPYLIVTNHGSLFDIAAVCMIQPDMGAFVAKESLFRIPIFGQAIGSGICIPINRHNLRDAQKAISHSIKKAKDRQSIIIFPEGTRTKNGELQTFKRGFIKIMRESGLDILPVTLNGFFNLKPIGRKFIEPQHKLEIKIHAPLKNEDLVKLDDKEINSLVKGVIENDYKFLPLKD